ncbi:MAG: prepilin-type N-terminal cleavage/methylation domain-containing protein [bacterium]
MKRIGGSPVLKPYRGFTLIELLIVVAIIGILAAIAVPNFLNAQVRARVARVEADLKSLSTAFEEYRLDNNRYIPRYSGMTRPGLFKYLTTPVSYISPSAFDDPFLAKFTRTNDDDPPTYFYERISGLSTTEATNGETAEPWKVLWYMSNTNHYRGALPGSYAYWLGSAGPDQTINADQRGTWGTPSADAPFDAFIDYSPSNGVISDGDINRLGP